MFVEIAAHQADTGARLAENGRSAPMPWTRSHMDRPYPTVGDWAVPEYWYVALKGAGESLAALVLLVLATPILLAAALLVKLTSRGPAFYTQKRVGQYGRVFTIYKVRTMIHNCESLTGPRWAMPGDPRVTRVGRLLRLTHIDELPQLLNVLRGEMSLIGPRPERPELVPELERGLPRYRDRLAVRPGLTGLAQIQLPPDTDLESVRRKLACDLYYVQHLGARLDLAISLCTVLRVLGIPNRWVRSLLGVPSYPAIDPEIQIARLDPPMSRLRKSA